MPTGYAARPGSGVCIYPGDLVAIDARTRDSKILAVVGALLGILRFVDFLFDGKHLYDLVATAGFLIVAIGAYLNGFQTLEAIAASGKKSSANGYAFALIGVALIVVSMILKYSQ